MSRETIRRLLTACALMSLCVAMQAAGSNVLLGFGEVYSGPQGSSVHRGIDIALADGEDARIPVAGTVTFAGRLPGAAEGIMAVTVSSADGLVTLSPLARAGVAKGQEVAAGECVGPVAATGDPSSPAAHLHISQRRNGIYVDPAGLLSAVAPSMPQPESAPSQAPVQVPAAPHVGARVMPGTATLAHGVSLAPLQATLPKGTASDVHVADGSVSGAAQPVARQAGAVCEGVSLAQAPLLSEVGGGSAPAASGTLGIQSPAAAAARVLATAARVLATAARGLAASPPAILLVFASLASAGLLFSRRALERRLQSNAPVSDRYETLLQHVRAGAKLCGLTSCSGLLPSQSRSRLAQRR